MKVILVTIRTTRGAFISSNRRRRTAANSSSISPPLITTSSEAEAAEAIIIKRTTTASEGRMPTRRISLFHSARTIITRKKMPSKQRQIITMTSCQRVATNSTASLKRWKMSFSHQCAYKWRAQRTSKQKKSLSHQKTLIEMEWEWTSLQEPSIALVRRSKPKRRVIKIRMQTVESPTW